ncbi:MAG TPA: septum site-determining protein MinC [Steroidobacter sp.]|nr:septum site-determining protein MinC [Steroidobacter sp.]
MNKASVAQEAPCEIRLGQVGLAQLRLHTLDAEAVHSELAARTAAAPQLFERAAVCLDLSRLDALPAADEMRLLFGAIRRAGFFPVGLMQGTAGVDALARELDLPALGQWRGAPKPALGALLKDISPPGKSAPPQETARPALAAPVADAPTSALFQQQPVRSGQRVYARHRDLIVAAAVGAGAEVMADGCVHVYGSLRGRALAGARGDFDARVFCQEFNAELVSIAGVFRVFETIPPELAGKPVQAWLDGDDLHFSRIGA